MQVSQMNVLEEMWTSKANCRQRKGRAGRVRSGVCYHLVSKFTMDRLPDYMTPEMLKMSLDDLILQVFYCLLVMAPSQYKLIFIVLVFRCWLWTWATLTPSSAVQSLLPRTWPSPTRCSSSSRSARWW